MSKLILREGDNFAIATYSLCKELGPVAAVVYGRIWSFCQMSNKVCSASLETISSEIGISLWTAERHIKTLVEAGYLDDLTPNLRKHPHTYRDTGKATAPQANVQNANLVVQNANPDLQNAPTDVQNSKRIKDIKELNKEINKYEDIDKQKQEQNQKPFSFESQNQPQEQEQNQPHSEEEKERDLIPEDNLISGAKDLDAAALPAATLFGDDFLARLRARPTQPTWLDIASKPYADARKKIAALNALKKNA